MATIQWHEEATKLRVTALVREVESKSSAELVITVRPNSGSYRAADIGFAAALAFLGLCLYVYAPMEFTDDLAPPSILIMFFAGLGAAGRAPFLRRAFSSKKGRAEQVRSAARAAFVDQGISCTRDRTGILIYVSVFEKRAEVVVDVGILRREAAGQPSGAIAEIERVVREGGDFEAFEKAIRALAVILEGSLPPRIDDQNELADEVNIA